MAGRSIGAHQLGLSVGALQAPTSVSIVQTQSASATASAAPTVSMGVTQAVSSTASTEDAFLLTALPSEAVSGIATADLGGVGSSVLQHPAVSAFASVLPRTRVGSLTAVRFEWAYHSTAFPRTGLGHQTCGAPTGLSEPAGHFIVKIRRGELDPVHTATTSNAHYDVTPELRDDLGLDDGNPWTVEVQHVEGSFTSTAAALTVRKRP